MVAVTSCMQIWSLGQLADSPQVAPAQGTSATNDGMGPAVGSDPDRVGRPEDADNGAAHGHRDVHRAGVIGHADGRPPDQGDQPGDGRLAGKVMGAGAGRDDRLAPGSIPGRPRNDNLVAGFEEVPADLLQSRRQCQCFVSQIVPGTSTARGFPAQSVGPKQFLDRPRRLRRQVDRGNPEGRRRAQASAPARDTGRPHGHRGWGWGSGGYTRSRTPRGPRSIRAGRPPRRDARLPPPRSDRRAGRIRCGQAHRWPR